MNDQNSRPQGNQKTCPFPHRWAKLSPACGRQGWRDKEPPRLLSGLKTVLRINHTVDLEAERERVLSSDSRMDK